MGYSVKKINTEECQKFKEQITGKIVIYKETPWRITSSQLYLFS